MKKLTEKKRNWIERTVANDRSNKRFLYNRFYLFALVVLLQLIALGFFMYLLTYNSAVAFSVQIVVNILALLIVLHIINKNDRPSAKLNWILLILILPFIGVPFYLWYGEGRPTRKMRRKLAATKKESEEQLLAIFQEEGALPQKRGEGASYYLQKHAKYPAFSDGKITYYDCGEKLFPELKAEIRKAEKFIFLEYFIIAHGKMWGDILKILLQKAEEGVKIFIIYDDFGCMTTLPPDYDKYLEALHENIRVLAFNQVVPIFDLRMNNRDHRKILVIDGKVAFTGGINLADEYIGEKRRFGYWKDTAIRVTGNAVCSFSSMFLYMWNAFRKDKLALEEYIFSPVNADMPPENQEKKGIIQPFDDSPLDTKSVSENVYVDMINRAVRYVYIFTPYLLLDDIVSSSLVRAAERGVDVRIVTPGIPDKKMIYRLTRANYGVLMKAGVQIYEYTPGFIHAKSLLCDGESAVVGTINFDYRSLYLHFEDGVYFTDEEALQALKKDCEETFALSRLCTKESVKRGVFGRSLDSILRVFEPLM